MATYVAFLRAINLGSKRRFGKDDVARATERTGVHDVSTYLSTGNVRLSTSMRSTTRIGHALETAYAEATGFEVPTVVLRAAELRGILETADEVGTGHEGKQFVSLLRDEPSSTAISAVEALSTPDETVRVVGRAAHLLLGEEYRTAAISGDVVERHLGVATNRSINVIRTVVDKWC